MGIYPVSAINRNREYIDNSRVKHADCDPTTITNLTSAAKLVTDNMTLAYQDLPVLTTNATAVEANRVNWINLFNKTAEQMRLRDWNIFNQTKLNETILIQQVILFLIYLTFIVISIHFAVFSYIKVVFTFKIFVEDHNDLNRNNCNPSFFHFTIV